MNDDNRIVKPARFLKPRKYIAELKKDALNLFEV